MVPLRTFVTVTFAFATAAPEGSVTVPKMLPKTAWPAADGTQRAVRTPSTAARRETEDLLIAFLSALAILIPFSALTQKRTAKNDRRSSSFLRLGEQSGFRVATDTTTP